MTIFGDEQVQSNSSVHQEHSFLHVVEPQLASIRVYEIVRFASGAVDSCQVEQVGGENAVDIWIVATLKNISLRNNPLYDVGIVDDVNLRMVALQES